MEVFVVALKKFFNLFVGHILIVRVLYSAVSVVGVFFEAVIFGVGGGSGYRVGGLAFGDLIYKYLFSMSLLILLKFLSLAKQLIDGCL